MNRKKSVALLLIALLTLLTVMPVTAFAAEDTAYEPTNAYVLRYNGTYSKKPIGGYSSPYFTSLLYESVIDSAPGPYQEVAGTICLFYSENEEKYLDVYCVDQFTRVTTKASYFKRINLEDSTFFSDDTAALLRAIFSQGFPSKTVEQLAKAAGVEGLTTGEAVHATQLAIWKAAYGDALTVDNLVDGPTIKAPYINATRNLHYDLYKAELDDVAEDPEKQAAAEARIKKVYNYLLDLEPIAPQQKSVSNASFINWSDAPVLTKNADGTYNVTVTTKVDVHMGEGDQLTLTAVMEDDARCYTGTALKNGTNEVTLTIQNVPASVANGKVTLAIDGQQTVSDVFLFVAADGRNSAQSLIGAESSQLPVHAEVTVEPERVINFHKTTADKKTPLEGIQFNIYFVADREEYLSGKVELPDPKDYDVSYGNSGYGIYNVVTDKNGEGTFNLTRNNCPDGVYLVVEQDHPAIEKPVDPFYVILPATSADGTKLEYTVNVYPKNQVRDEVEIEKDVISLGNNSATVDAYKTHTWIISTAIPSDIANGSKYIISDTLDNRLDYKGNLKVQLETTDGKTVAAVLTEGVDYTLSVTDRDSLSEGKPSDAFQVSLTTAGMRKVAAAATPAKNYRVRVYFDAQINANAQMGQQIPNQAALKYTNSVGVDFDKESDIPEVHTGGVRLVKVDAKDNTVKLTGAEFQLYRPATEAEVADDTITKVTLKGITAPMVQVGFYGNAELTGDKVTTAVSDENGDVIFYGLAYGEYYLVETKSPAGYNLLGDPVKLTLNETSHLTENAQKVANVSGIELPETGGIGTTGFMVMGTVMVLMAYAIVVVRRKSYN